MKLLLVGGVVLQRNTRHRRAGLWIIRRPAILRVVSLLSVVRLCSLGVGRLVRGIGGLCRGCGNADEERDQCKRQLAAHATLSKCDRGTLSLPDATAQLPRHSLCVAIPFDRSSSRAGLELI